MSEATKNDFEATTKQNRIVEYGVVEDHGLPRLEMVLPCCLRRLNAWRRGSGGRDAGGSIDNAHAFVLIDQPTGRAPSFFVLDGCDFFDPHVCTACCRV